MSTSDYSHQPVLFREVLNALVIRDDGIYVDGTYGRGGHAAAILERLGEKGRLLVMDKDPQAIASAKASLSDDARVTIIHDDYAHLLYHLEQLGLQQSIDGVLLDLGVSSPQLDQAERGFSFQQNGPLDMRMDTTQGISAADWLMSAAEKEIAQVLWELGEERHSRRIARRIVEYRQEQPIRDTATLAALISDCIPAGKQHKHPATRSFQAIRIKINHELEHLQQLLADIFDVLKIGGRVLIISFHSLEDRLVKRFFKKHATAPSLPKGLPLREDQLTTRLRLRSLGKAIKATSEEVRQNPRARSAVLRIAERIA